MALTTRFFNLQIQIYRKMSLPFTGIDTEKYQVLEDEAYSQLMNHILALGQVSTYATILEGTQNQQK